MHKASGVNKEIRRLEEELKRNTRKMICDRIEFLFRKMRHRNMSNKPGRVAGVKH